MSFIKKVRFVARNLQSVISILKLEIGALTEFGDISHGPEFLHGIPPLVFMALLIGGTFVATHRTLHTHMLKPYQVRKISVLRCRL